MNIHNAKDMARRSEILNGVLNFPVQILDTIPTEKEIYEDMFQAIWCNYLREKHTSTLVWYEQVVDKNTFNSVLFHLSKAGWITSNMESNYAWLELNESKLLKWVTKEELIAIKKEYKFNKYRLNATESTYVDKVKIGNKTVCTGLIREGFKKAGNNKFTYDTDTMMKYVYDIGKEITKHIETSTKDVGYDEIVLELLGYYANNTNKYTLGSNTSDSRGRAIFKCTSKVFNPISNKEARALIRCPSKRLNEEGLNTVYAFISELLGYKAIGGTYSDKILYGKAAYAAKQLSSILHEEIWLSRLYKGLDDHKNGSNWDIPIELDK